MPGLPTVLVTEVVRSTHQGDSHGGAYLVDLETGGFERVLDWNTMDISWEGRGADRGLRGIAFGGDRVFIAASDAVFVFDRSFEVLGSHTCPTLEHCHEICLDGDTLYLTSTGYDSVLEMDAATGSFTAGWWLEVFGPQSGASVRLHRFDPNLPVAGGDEGGGAPLRRDLLHINNVSRWAGVTLVSALRYPGILSIADGDLGRFTPIRQGTHNAQPFGDDVIFNATTQDATMIADRRGLARAVFRVPSYDRSELTHADLPEDHARQGFARGLCWTDEFVIVGSSPTTISAYARGTWERVASVNVTMDVRHCPHGLEVWPW